MYIFCIFCIVYIVYYTIQPHCYTVFLLLSRVFGVQTLDCIAGACVPLLYNPNKLLHTYVPLPCFHIITLLNCCLVTLLSCYIVVLLHCCLATLLYCYIVRFLHSFIITLLYCYIVTLLLQN